MSQYLVVFIIHFEFDLGQVELICEIFRNNKKICLEKHMEITDDFVNLIKTNGRQAKFLEFFKIIQCVNDEYLLANQKNVLNVLFDPKIKHHVLYMKESGNKKYAFE